MWWFISLWRFSVQWPLWLLFKLPGWFVSAQGIAILFVLVVWVGTFSPITGFSLFFYAAIASLFSDPVAKWLRPQPRGTRPKKAPKPAKPAPTPQARIAARPRRGPELHTAYARIAPELQKFLLSEQSQSKK